MASLTTFLLVYLFGGVTFIPLLLALAIYIWTQPVLLDAAASPTADAAPKPSSLDASAPPDGGSLYDDIVLPGDDTKTLQNVRREHAETRAGNGYKHRDEVKKRRHDPADDFATAGYFAVYRKYVAMGVNSKPIEPSSVGPATVAPPSPSVYQTFFRSMLNKKPGPETVEISNASSPRPKNARNMFYVVLRHGHLILFDDAQQVDVRHVIKLADHDVDLYSGGNVTPEGELFIKRNALRLSPKNPERAKAHNVPVPQPWFFYSENCIEKEDFYFALLRSQEHPPQPHDIDVRHLTALMERLHASEEAAETRWLNALLGRLFLGVYKTSDLLRFIESKVIIKLSRTPRPSFISSLVVQRVDIGDTTPQITSPRLKSLTAEGECIIEADVRYSGRFEIDLAATMRVSTPVGQQEVKTSLAAVFTRLDGHMLFKIKAPPSNRIWFSFRHMPKIEMEIRPIIMARQLTWPVFIKMIEGKIKEAIAESIVLPFWDDVPFFRTEGKKWRGGLWEDETEDQHEGTAIRTAASVEAAVNGAAATDQRAASSTGVSANGTETEENVSPAVMRLRRLSKTHSAPTPPIAAAASSTSVNSIGGHTSDRDKPALPKRPNRMQQTYHGSDADIGTSPPKRFSRTPSSLTSPSEPTIGTDNFHAEASIPSSSPPKNGKQASTAMSWLSSGTLRSRKSSVSSAESGGLRRRGGENTSSSNNEDDIADPIFSISDSEATEDAAQPVLSGVKGSRASTISSRSAIAPSARASSSSLQTTPTSGTRSSTVRRKPVEPSFTTTITSEAGTPPPKRSAQLAAAMSGAAASAKRWGMNALQQRRAAAAERKTRTALEQRTSSGEPFDLSKPMGGGRPLPPPGEPLPLPSELALARDSSSSLSIPRKPAPVGRRGTGDMKSQSQAHTPTRDQNGEAGEHESQPQPKQDRHQDEQSHNELAASSEETLSRHRQAAEDDPKVSTPSFQQQDILVVEAPIDSDSEDGNSETHEVGEDHADQEYHDEHDGHEEHEGWEEHDIEENEHDVHAEESEVGAHEKPISVIGTLPEVDTADSDNHSLGPSGLAKEAPFVDTPNLPTPPNEVAGQSHQERSDDHLNSEEADTEQWGTLAESVISAFLEEDGQGEGHTLHEHDAHDEQAVLHGASVFSGEGVEAEPESHGTDAQDDELVAQEEELGHLSSGHHGS